MILKIESNRLGVLLCLLGVAMMMRADYLVGHYREKMKKCQCAPDNSIQASLLDRNGAPRAGAFLVMGNVSARVFLDATKETKTMFGFVWDKLIAAEKRFIAVPKDSVQQ